MTTKEFHAIPEINWTLRSLLAAVAVSFCVLVTAMSATASVKRSEAVKVAETAIANEAQLVAEFADFLADETAEARAEFDAPRLKPAQSASNLVMEGGAIADLVNFDFTQFTIAEMDAEDRKCLAQAIYYEARSESRIGQLAVADVVLNRVDSKHYPQSICDVVYQGSLRRTGCQFSFTCDGSMNATLHAQRWKNSELLAGAILAGLRVPVSRNATHYHADYVSPPWADKLTPTATIGTHKFYKFPNRRTVAAAPAAM